MDFGLWTSDLGLQARCRALLLAIVTAGMAGGIFYNAQATRLDQSALPRPWLNAPFVRTPDAIVDEMLAMAAPRPDELLYDLGCGDGRIVVRAAEFYGCRAVGFDIDPQRVREAQQNARRHVVDNRVTIVEQDVFKLDLSQADVVTLYLLPRLNERLIPQLMQLKPGSRIVSHDFDLPGIVPDRVLPITVSDHQVEHLLYLWTAPLRAAASEE
ncbi:MAG TPA: methyltransferase domain-containing protein [Pirellulales bacterium]|nr:methyltransferase domain-containing protein [Pirellulales bacterium]